MTSIPAKAVSGEQDLAPGDFHFRGEGMNGQPKWLHFGCPRGDASDPGRECMVALAPQKNGAGASWSFDGNRVQPTLTPSIDCRGGCGWHGFLEAGAFRDCGD